MGAPPHLLAACCFLLPVFGILAWLGFLSMTCARAETPQPANLGPTFEQVLKIDVHVHVFDDLPQFVEMLRRTRMLVVNVCVGGSQPELLLPCEKRAEQFRQHYFPNFVFASTFDLTRRNEPGYVRQVTNWIDATFGAGAELVKIWKDVGMGLKTPSGEYLMPDDPLLDPIYSHLARGHRPLVAHFADPIDAWRPLDPSSPHHAYYAGHPVWHVYGRQGFPSHSDILAARDRVLAAHPDLLVIAAHLGSEAHDLAELGRRLDRFPNLYVDVAARTPELQRQPAARVRQFFQQHQDRLLYATDADQYTEGRPPTASEQQAFTQKMERWYRQDFEYYAGHGKLQIGGKTVECLGLPRAILDKFYHQNAQRLIPGLRSS